MAEQEVGLKLSPIVRARITIKDKDGNIKFDDFVTFEKAEEEKENGCNPDNGG